MSGPSKDSVPFRRGLICCAVMAAAQVLCYFIPRLFLSRLTLHVLTGPLDARIPFSPPWIVVYCLSYPFWGIGWFLIGSREKTRAFRLTAAYVLAMLLSAAMFLLWPGTMERPEITGHDLFSEWTRLIYRADSPTNLCPSVHVLASCFCWRGTMGNSGIPRWYRIFSFVFFLLVCASVLLVKQHALIDVPAGILFCELALQCARIFRMERIPFSAERFFRK